jgi:GrpB-like predicted nucleotidyltransferase (UPF0157 family)
VAIEIVPYDPTWPSEYAKEQTSILDAAGKFIRVIEHIGSTAVVGLAAKPIIDIAVGVDSVDAVQSHVVGTLEPLGYKPFDAGMPGRLFLFRGETEQHTHHLHVLPLAWWDDLKERLFRDWLRDHPVDRDRYAALKRALAEAHTDMSSYTRAKTSLIQELVDAARAARGLPPVPVWEE